MRKITRLLLSGLVMLGALGAQAQTFVGARDDFRDETIYFAMTTRFYDGDPTNNVLSWDKQDVQVSKNDPDWRGDFKGLIDKLDYIKALGFTAIWITPIVQNASGEDYHGYHAMDFTSVDLRYESRKEWGAEKDVKFQDLIDAAHAKGMKIVLDIVLQHTSNFGEVNLNPLFTRNQNIRNQATPAGALIPNPALFSSNYFEQSGEAQYKERWKYFKNPQYEPNNYYHHYGTGWNWDYPNRWWGQIAGDCVDLNTENNYVAEYIVKCYGKFIEMGVDGFRIDTTGHIAPLTFNKQFVPQFLALGEKYKDKRLNGCPFYMFGECCQRYSGTVVYRDHPNLSSYFYTWESDEALLDEFNGDPAWWAQQNLPEGHDTPVGPMAVCEKDTQDKPRSNNAWMVNGQWHEPDYSQASGLNVIDFPMHYNFSNVSSAIGYARQDDYYNDATYNVVYVDSHDYCPGPNDGTRFNGGTEQWAENLSLMFTFRGIPCIYYGSEVEFKKGCPIDVGGVNNKTPRSQSGRAYFGNYLEGTVSASDFGQYTASGNVAKTLDADLAQHVRRLNLIRAAVPALRKGQYTWDGCLANGGWAYKRAYKDSYVLVALNGGATFSNVPAGTYTDIVTGKTYNGGGSITVDAPSNKGQLRVLVKDWKGGKVGEDGKFIYDTAPVSHGGSVEFDDPGTTHYYTSDDVVGNPEVKLTPGATSFKTETLNVTAALNEAAVSGWYKVGDNAQVALTPGKSVSFTIGQNMEFGQSVTVTWSATGADNATFSGQATYKKVDPNAMITVYVTGKNNTDISGTNLYVWDGKENKLNGEWPGKALTDKTSVNGTEFYYASFDAEEINIIFNRNGAKTGDIENIDSDVYYEYDGGTNATKLDIAVTKRPSVKANPASGTTFNKPLTVTLTPVNATEIHYTLDGTTPTAASKLYTAPIVLTATTTVKTYVSNSEGENVQSFTYTYSDAPAPTGYNIYFDNSNSNWNNVNIYVYGNGLNDFIGSWPGKAMTYDASLGYWHYFIATDQDLTKCYVIFNNGDKLQTGDNVLIVNNGIYNANGYTGLYSGIEGIVAGGSALKVWAQGAALYVESAVERTIDIVRLDGTVVRRHIGAGTTAIDDLARGFYIVAGTKVLLR